MDKFWKWMEEKEYIELYGDHCVVPFFQTSVTTSLIPKQMLIGYMEEYLITEFGISIGNSSNIYSRLNKGGSFKDIRYEELEYEIERRK